MLIMDERGMGDAGLFNPAVVFAPGTGKGPWEYDVAFRLAKGTSAVRLNDILAAEKLWAQALGSGALLQFRISSYERPRAIYARLTRYPELLDVSVSAIQTAASAPQTDAQKAAEYKRRAQQQVLAQQIAASPGATTGQEVFEPGGKFYNPQHYAERLAADARMKQFGLPAQTSIQVQPGTPINWGPLPAGTSDEPERLTVTARRITPSPLWWILGAAAVVGGLLLLRRKK